MYFQFFYPSPCPCPYSSLCSSTRTPNLGLVLSDIIFVYRCVIFILGGEMDVMNEGEFCDNFAAALAD